MPMIFGRLEGLNGHDRSMDHARPDREPDETPMFERVACRDDQKHPESRVNTDNHQRVIRVTGMPSPARRPNDHQRADSDQENQPTQYQWDTQVFGAIVVGHNFVFSLDLHSIVRPIASADWARRGPGPMNAIATT